MLKHRDLPLVAAVLLAGYFLHVTAPGLTTHFAPDDPQNIYGYWSRGVPHAVQANLLVATSSYRPMGAIFYLPLFHFFGFNPLPYRVAIFALLWVNAWLFYCLARRLTGSREAGALAALTGCFHANAAGVFYSTAVVYEVTCFLFLAAALLYYVRIRQDRGALNAKQNVLLLLLFAAALNSKEMAVVLPPALLLYEALYRGAGFRHAFSRTLIAPILATGALAAAYAYAKAFGSGAFTQYEAYRPLYTMARYLETTRTYAGAVLLSEEPLDGAAAIAFWAALFAIAAALRNRAMGFGAAFALLAFLPVNFVAVREGFVLYIPLIGFGVYAGALLAALLDLIAARLRLTPEHRRQIGAIAYVALLVSLVAAHYARTRELDGAMRHAQEMTWNVIGEFQGQRLRFKPGERVLFANTPFTGWDVYFLAKLYARDRSLQVGVVTAGTSEVRGDAHDRFDQEFRCDGGKLIKTK